MVRKFLKHFSRFLTIERGIAGPGLLARVLTAKYCEDPVTRFSRSCSLRR
ncbi:TPA: hypothetical protein G8N56_005117 [Salmonella enterica]|nr:hypothetical protein [Salmonella enterica]